MKETSFSVIPYLSVRAFKLFESILDQKKKELFEDNKDKEDFSSIKHSN